ncbi:hypothetical protein RI844_07195 [Thalassotalea fonticola]|uniref:Fibronectin type III domain-containing protein n=1 Tax=Thalassotalea fonticola TaxID=3065649 RepID=A0ABZ0GSR0_9GAMM|nr:hypothetical protein RI844_07195 [Colwelliaceae bacterium S1-1]
MKKYFIIATCLLLSACGADKEQAAKEMAEPVLSVPPVASPPETQQPETQQPETQQPETQQPETQQPETLTVEPNLATPKKLNLRINNTDISLMWPAVKGATSYRVYFNEGEDVTTDADFVEVSSAIFRQSNLTEATHSFRIQAVFANNKASDLSSLATLHLQAGEAGLSDSYN